MARGCRTQAPRRSPHEAKSQVQEGCQGAFEKQPYLGSEYPTVLPWRQPPGSHLQGREKPSESSLISPVAASGALLNIGLADTRPAVTNAWQRKIRPVHWLVRLDFNTKKLSAPGYFRPGLCFGWSVCHERQVPNLIRRYLDKPRTQAPFSSVLPGLPKGLSDAVACNGDRTGCHRPATAGPKPWEFAWRIIEDCQAFLLLQRRGCLRPGEIQADGPEVSPSCPALICLVQDALISWAAEQKGTANCQ